MNYSEYDKGLLVEDLKIEEVVIDKLSVFTSHGMCNKLELPGRTTMLCGIKLISFRKKAT